ncbi:MAG: 50S ribosomal protein L21 [Parcubacteria group bacterium]|jgi:large subunit ribosomal protein L21|nr:50S ribosomal protein L21 [Parcubacteria group bacterium]
MAEKKEAKKESKKGPAKASKAVKTVKKAAPVKTKPEDGAFAVIETGGKQYRVIVGDTIKIEKLNTELKEGDPVVFDKVLLFDNGSDFTDIGTPYINGVKVSGKLVEIGRNAKVTVIKYKSKSRYFKKSGHRQPFFKVKIEKIG